jgi:hypothetical protein
MGICGSQKALWLFEFIRKPQNALNGHNEDYGSTHAQYCDDSH